MKKVALLTTFYEVTSGFSLITVAQNQIEMLEANGYDPRVLVVEGLWREDDHGNRLDPIPFQEHEDTVWNRGITDLRPVLPALKLQPGGYSPAAVATILNALRENLEDVNVCITHDIILQDTYLEYNAAMRNYASMRPDLLWLHFIHSVPVRPDPVPPIPQKYRFVPPPGYIVYPNNTEVGRVCRAYECQPWRVVSNRASHSIDPLRLGKLESLTIDLAEGADLLGGDVVAVYPARLDRGKQPEKVIRLLAGVKDVGLEMRLLIVDWQSGGKRFQKYIKELNHLARELGVGNSVFFTSRLDDRCSQGVPRDVVLELMSLANVYVHPSMVETYSLVVHEAILMGCLPVLNHDTPQMRELFGEAVYMDFGSDTTKRDYSPDEQSFWNDEARRLIAELSVNKSLRLRQTARTKWTPAAQWQEFEPLLYKTAVGAA